MVRAQPGVTWFNFRFRLTRSLMPVRFAAKDLIGSGFATGGSLACALNDLAIRVQRRCLLPLTRKLPIRGAPR